LDLEKDPTPGDPVRVKSLAKSLHDFADDVQDALRLVKGMADEDPGLPMSMPRWPDGHRFFRPRRAAS
jgi:hypothetical protein